MIVNKNEVKTVTVFKLRSGVRAGYLIRGTAGTSGSPTPYAGPGADQGMIWESQPAIFVGQIR